MSRESPTFRATLMRNRERAEELGITAGELNMTQAARIIGRHVQTVRRSIRERGNPYGFVNGKTTIEKISRAQSWEP